MKKKRITYGVSGMMEYQCIIRFGKNSLKVTFTGGSMNAIGVTPATFTTSNFLIQQTIENSSEFKRGRIHIVNAIDLDEELHIERPAPIKEEGFAEAQPDDKNLRDDKKQLEEGQSKSAEEQKPEEVRSEEALQTALLTQVEFSCNDDAKDYLEQTFGCVRSKLRNREDIVNAGKAHNVEIIFV